MGELAGWDVREKHVLLATININWLGWWRSGGVNERERERERERDFATALNKYCQEFRIEEINKNTKVI